MRKTIAPPKRKAAAPPPEGVGADRVAGADVEARGGATIPDAIALHAAAWGLLVVGPLAGLIGVVSGVSNRLSEAQEAIVYPLGAAVALLVFGAAVVAALARESARPASLARSGGAGLAPAAVAGAALWLGGGAALAAMWAPLGVAAWLRAALLPLMATAWCVLLLRRPAGPTWWRQRPLLFALLVGNALLIAQVIPVALGGFDFAALLRGDTAPTAASRAAERGALLTLAGHPNFLGSTLVALFFLKLHALTGAVSVRSGDGRADALPPLGAGWRAAVVALLLGDVVALFLVGARGAFLSVMVGSIAFFVLRHGLRRWGVARLAAIGGGAMAALLLAALLALLALMPRAADHAGGSQTLADRLLARGPVTTRVHHWLVATELWRRHPVFGVGPGQFNARYWELLAQRLEQPAGAQGREVVVSPFLLGELDGRDPDHAHNELFHAAAEGGAAGLLGLVMLSLATLAAAVMGREPALAAGVLAVAVDAQFGFPLHTPAALAPLSLLAGACWAGVWAGRARGSDRPAAASMSRDAMSRAAMATAGALVSLGALLLLSRETLLTWSQEQLLRAMPTMTAPERADAEERLLQMAGQMSEGDIAARAALALALERDARAGGAGAVSVPSALREPHAPIDLQAVARADQVAGALLRAHRRLSLASRLDPADPTIAVDWARVAMERWNRAKRLARLTRADLQDPRSESARFAAEVIADESLRAPDGSPLPVARADDAGRALLPRTAADLRAAIDHLRVIDFRHPLIAYAEGLMAEENGSPLGALRIYERLANESPADRGPLQGVSGATSAAQAAFADLIRERVRLRAAELRAQLAPR